MEITWKKIGEDDFKAEPEPGVLLRVESMGFIWWWGFQDEREFICVPQDGFEDSEEDAKTKCIEAYKKLKDEQNTNEM